MGTVECVVHQAYVSALYHAQETEARIFDPTKDCGWTTSPETKTNERKKEAWRMLKTDAE